MGPTSVGDFALVGVVELGDVGVGMCAAWAVGPNPHSSLGIGGVFAHSYAKLACGGLFRFGISNPEFGGCGVGAVVLA
jgi:hypothetical protein